MDPNRKRRLRLIVALTVALLLAGALVYTSFSAADVTVTPSQLLTSALPGRSYQLTGKVVPGSIRREGVITRFSVRDRAGTDAVPIVYSGQVPDPFGPNREIIVDVRKQGSSFIGQRDSLVTKCPSKFTAAPANH